MAESNMILTQDTKLPMSIIGPCAVVLVLVALWLGSVQSAANEADRKAEVAIKAAADASTDAQSAKDKSSEENKQILIMFGNLKEDIGELKGLIKK